MCTRYCVLHVSFVGMRLVNPYLFSLARDRAGEDLRVQRARLPPFISTVSFPDNFSHAVESQLGDRSILVLVGSGDRAILYYDAKRFVGWYKSEFHSITKKTQHKTIVRTSQEYTVFIVSW